MEFFMNLKTKETPDFKETENLTSLNIVDFVLIATKGIERSLTYLHVHIKICTEKIELSQDTYVHLST